jgi:hypothetical protein
MYHGLIPNRFERNTHPTIGFVTGDLFINATQPFVNDALLFFGPALWPCSSFYRQKGAIHP